MKRAQPRNPARLLPVVAAFFSALNAIILWVRIREENAALQPHR